MRKLEKAALIFLAVYLGALLARLVVYPGKVPWEDKVMTAITQEVGR